MRIGHTAAQLPPPPPQQRRSGVGMFPPVDAGSFGVRITAPIGPERRSRSNAANRLVDRAVVHAGPQRIS